MRYPCSPCEHVATRASDLKRLVESTHEGVSYPCSQCEHVAIRASHLKSRVESIHNEWDILALNVSMLQQEQVI